MFTKITIQSRNTPNLFLLVQLKKREKKINKKQKPLKKNILKFAQVSKTKRFIAPQVPNLMFDNTINR